MHEIESKITKSNVKMQKWSSKLKTYETQDRKSC